MKLTELYKSILNYCGMGVNDHGEIDIVADPENIHPATIEGRRLVLPVQDQLKTYHPDKKVIFHPLQEHIDRGASDVVKKLQYLISIKINNAIIEIGADLLKLAGSPATHSNLDPDQRLLIRGIPGAELTSAANFVKFIAKPFTAAPASSIVSIFLKKAGTYKGVKHSRVGIVSFPIYEHIENANIKKTDQATYQHLMEFMFPGSQEENSDEYNSFSDSKDAPWLDVMLKTSFTLTQRLNELLDTFGDFIENKDALRFDTRWLDGMDNAEQFRAEIRRIPDQRGNEGSITKPNGEEEAVIKPAVSEIPSRPVVAVPAPKEASSGPYRQADEPPVYQHPPQGYYPQAPGYPQQPQPPQYPQAAYGAPGYPQQPPPPQYPQGYPQSGYPQQPPPRHAVPGPDGKISLQAIEAVNPAVHMSGQTPTPLLNAAWNNSMPQQQMGYPQQGYDPRFPQQQGYPQQGYDPRFAPQQQMMDPRLARPMAPQQPYVFPGYRQQAPQPQQGYDPRFGYPGQINPII